MRLGPALGAPAALTLAVMLGVALGAGGATAGMTPQPVAVMQGLDKITARVSRFEAPVGKTVTFFSLSIVVRECERSAPEDRPENAAFVQIYETRPGEEQRRVFSGWMFSSSPALSAIEHPVYDVNLLECKGAIAPSPPHPAPASPAPKPPGGSRGNTAR
ncbi:MAG TPA: DUF2155 domain-containing protein [Stellaceae bacterium]|nr:DUF2155 domain-containing protein [Stellaceae bacterium]